ncbi:MAG: T9SS type A sorting domain-containing protein [Ignavibacteria bacterium]|nr:T9SS type A sorting domain-containing protein [Ignavibacteria bacterium]
MKNRYATIALSVMLFAAFGLAGVHAQTTITIGTGTGTSSYPVYLLWEYSGSVALYTSADLGQAGWNCGSGTITNLKWNVSTSSSYTGGTIRIYMKNTTQTSVSSGAIDTSGTLVWAGSNPGFTSTGWKDFSLQNPFSYTSGSNVLVTVFRQDNNWSSSASFTYTTASGMHSSDANDGALPASLTSNSNRPNIQMTFSANCAQPPAITINSAPTCPSSSNQSVNSTITVSGGTVSDARVWFRKNAGTWYNSTATTISGSTYTFTINHTTLGGVTGGDLVEWYLGALSSASLSITSPYGGGGNPPGTTPPATFYSYKIPPALPYLESFEGGTAGWTFGGTNSSWRRGTPPATLGGAAFQGTNALVCSDPANANQYHDAEASWAMSPTFSFTGAPSDPVLVFEHKYSFESGWDGGKVEYTTNGGASWSQLGTLNDANGLNWYDAASVNGCSGPVFSPTSSVWRHSVRTLSGLAGQGCVQLRFWFCSDGSVMAPGWAIDNVQVGFFPQKDVQVASVNLSYAANRWAFVETLPHSVTANIQNNGWEANPTTVTLVYKLGSAPTSAVDGVAQTFTPTWVSGKASCTFTTPIVPAAAGPINLYVKAFYTGDLVPANDQVLYPATIQGIKVFGFENFEGLVTGGPNWRTGWSHLNNGGANGWTLGTTGLSGSAQPTVAFWSPDGNPNETLISPPALLAAGASYRVQFKAAVNNGSATVKLLFGKTADPATMTVINTWTVSNTSFQPMLGPIVGVAPYFNTDPAGASNYYIAFQIVAPVTTTGSVQIDDVILDENPTPPPKIGYGLPGTPNGQHVDNAAVPLQLFAIYKKPGVINHAYEVVSTTYNYGAPGDFLWDVVSNTPWIKITKSVANPTQYLASNPFLPARPRQLQTFTLEVDPTQFLPGTYTGSLTMYGKLYNSQYPAGISATNEPYPVTVQLNVTSAGSGVPGAPTSLKACVSTMPASVTPYLFKDGTGKTFAAVTVTSGAIPSMCIEAFPAQLPAGIARYRYVERYFKVTAGGSGWTANIDWYYTDSEAAAGGITAPNKLRCIRQLTSGGVWQDPTIGVTSTSVPASYYVRGTGYTPANISGNHALVTNWVPKAGSSTIPTGYALGQNYPNPFNPSTKIDFSVPEDGQVRLAVYNSLGDEVATLVNEVVSAGSYSVTFDASTLPSGMYVYRLISGNFSESRTMMLAK